MPEADVLQRGFAVEVLLSFFQIDVVFMVIRFAGVVHIFFHVKIHPADRIHQLDESLEVGIHIILNRDAQQVGDRLHGRIRTMGDRRIDPIRAVLRNFRIRVAQNREEVTLLAHRV
ncbi:hypothetical protein D3C81_666090 [compost metagenome]